jgi:hypothetical protein
MHAFFNILGAARADEKDLRNFLDYYKTLIVLSESHDGKGLIEQPFGTERYGNCSGLARDRKTFSYTTVLIFSIPKRKLLITGADFDKPAGPTTAKAYTPSDPSTPSSSSTTSVSEGSPADAPAATVSAPAHVQRKARTITPEKVDKLDATLQGILVKLSDAGALKDVPLSLSPTKAKVYLKGADSEGKLTLQVVSGSDKARLSWRHLSAQDTATLALYVADIKPDSKDAQAIAGVYLEKMGNVDKADQYYEKAGPDSRKKLEALFN